MLRDLLKPLVELPDRSRYQGGVRFFFRCEHLHYLANEFFDLVDNRSPEVNAIADIGGFNTVEPLQAPELQEWMFQQIKPVLEKDQVKFKGSCIALMYYPDYIKSNLHIHRESLRLINDSPYNYTFYWNTNKSTVNFNIIEHRTTYEEIVQYNLINYSTTETCQEFSKDKTMTVNVLEHGDYIKFNATTTIHGATPNWDDDSIGLFLVLSGCRNEL